MEFQNLFPGIWKGTVGQSDAFSPLRQLESKASPFLSEFPTVPFPFAEEDCLSSVDGHHAVAVLPLEADEKLYGCGLQFLSVEQRGKTRYLRVNSDPKQDTGESHAPVAFYVSSHNYGILVDTARIVSLCLGSTVRKASKHPPVCRNSTDDPAWKATMLSDSVEIATGGEGFDLYCFAAGSMLDVVRKYVLFTGGGAMPPLWALGFWYRVPSTDSQEQVLSAVDAFEKRGYPVDVVGLEPGWHSTNYPCSYLWHPGRFPQPDAFMDEMRKRQVRVNNWEHAWVSPEAPFYQKMKPYAGDHTVWGGLAPDWTMDGARTLFQEHHEKELLDRGVSGFKLDECDGSELTDCSWMFPSHALFPGGADGEEMRQLYGLFYQKTVTEMFGKRNLRTWGLVRASGIGGSSLPFVLYSDLYDHREYIRALVNSSFSGLLWTPEVRRAKNGEEWVRRIESVVFSPLAMINAWGDGTVPWSFPEVEDTVRKYLLFRMRLVPYLFTAYALFHQEGIPPVRSMELMFGDLTTRLSEEGHKEFDTVDAPYGRTKSFSFDSQYMLGDSLLVAPMFSGETERQVYLPKGMWFTLEEGVPYEGNRMVTVTPGVETIPVFVKDGTLLPLMPPLQRAPSSPVQLSVVPYGETEGKSVMVYDDDGIHVDSSSSWMRITMRAGKTVVDAGGELWHWKREVMVEKTPLGIIS
jgi:alpha-D-xyloside xylohydrolase